MTAPDNEDAQELIRALTPQPYSFRLPRNGERDVSFGGTRTFWAELIRENGQPARVQSFLVRKPGQPRGGTRFILYSSAMKFMQQQASQGRQGNCGDQTLKAA